jgi:hypothetical protein
MLVEGGSGWSGRENLGTLESSCHPLGVECAACRHRALVPFRVLRGCGYEMTPIKSLPLVCRCGSRDWRATIFQQDDDIAAWQLFFCSANGGRCG